MACDFANPLINPIDPDTIEKLPDLLAQPETDEEMRAIVFSAEPDFFLAYYDALVDKARTAAMPPGYRGGSTCLSDSAAPR